MLPTLSSLRPGQSARVLGLRPGCPMLRRFQDLGLIEGTLVRCLYDSPLGDPKAYLIRGAVIAIRRSDGDTVAVDPVPDPLPAVPAEQAVPYGAA